MDPSYNLKYVKCFERYEFVHFFLFLYALIIVIYKTSAFERGQSALKQVHKCVGTKYHQTIIEFESMTRDIIALLRGVPFDYNEAGDLVFMGTGKYRCSAAVLLSDLVEELTQYKFFQEDIPQRNVLNVKLLDNDIGDQYFNVWSKIEKFFKTNLRKDLDLSSQEEKFTTNTIKNCINIGFSDKVFMDTVKEKFLIGHVVQLKWKFGDTHWNTPNIGEISKLIVIQNKRNGFYSFYAQIIKFKWIKKTASRHVYERTTNLSLIHLESQVAAFVKMYHLCSLTQCEMIKNNITHDEGNHLYILDSVKWFNDKKKFFHQFCLNSTNYETYQNDWPYDQILQFHLLLVKNFNIEIRDNYVNKMT